MRATPPCFLNIGRNTFQSHNSYSTCLLGNFGLLRGSNVHYDSTFELIIDSI